MYGEVEHANICVRDIDQTVAFLTTALPGFRIRHRGLTAQGKSWLHIGTDATYLAISQASPDEDCGDVRLNHLGFRVDDTDAVKKRCLDAGYKEGMVAEPHPFRRRLYILDHESIEWEFVEYLSDDPSECNDYSDD